jgi:hypothetical protein
MSQDVQINLSSETRDRINRLKPDFTFRNVSGMLDFLLEIYRIVKPLILHGDSLTQQELIKVAILLKDKAKFLKEKEFKGGVNHSIPEEVSNTH